MNALKPYRAKIDALDDRIVDLLAERMEIVRAVGRIKSAENLELIQSDRVTEVCERCAARGAEKGLESAFVRRLYETIIDEAHRMEREIITNP